jgi:hypothetical protein
MGILERRAARALAAVLAAAGLVLLAPSTAGAAEKVLSLTVYKQEESNWCWAGEARTLARQCYKTAAYLFTSGGRPHPCESRAIFMPGSNILGAAKHKHRAIVQHPEWIQLTRGYRPESKERWCANEAECVGSSPATPCDEYPYRSTQQGGPAVPFGKARASLRIIDRSSNSAEGAFLSSFWARCNVDNGEMFLVVPTVVDAVQPDGEELESNLSAPPTIGFCEVG